MEKHLIFVYAAYFFTFLVLMFIGIKSFLGFKTSNKKVSNIKNKVKIGASSVVGIGSVVINNVEDNMTVFGNPSRIISKSNVS